MDGDKQRRCTNFECIHPANFPVRENIACSQCYSERARALGSPRKCAECSCDLTTWIYTGKAYDWKGDETGVCDDCAWTSRWPWPTVHSVVYPTDSTKLARR